MNSEIEVFDELIRQFEEKTKENQIKIIIFGPGEYNLKSFPKQCYNKRIQIRDLLIANGHNALLPEDAIPLSKSMGKEINNTLFEWLLINHHCDLAVFLYVSDCKGLEHELSAFTLIPEIARKMMCYREKGLKDYWTQKDRFDLIQRHGGQLYEFDENDIIVCHLATKVLEIAENLRRIAFYLPFIKY